MKNSLQKTVLALAAVGVLLSCPARGDEDKGIVTPLSLALTSSLQFPAGEQVDVYGLRLGVLVFEELVFKGEKNKRTDVYGVSVGLLVMAEYDYGTVTGIQLSSLHNATDTLNGIQFSCLNIANHMSGIQLGLLNIAINDNDASGFQIGVGNYALSNVYGFQVGLVNAIIEGNLCGIQLGLVNATGDARGVQVGLANLAVKNVHGVQLGVYNYADTLKGLQIGLLNHHGDNSFPLLMVGW